MATGNAREQRKTGLAPFFCVRNLWLRFFWAWPRQKSPAVFRWQRFDFMGGHVGVKPTTNGLRGRAYESLAAVDPLTNPSTGMEGS